MRILFVSGALIGSAIVHRLIAEGHDVRLYIDDPCCKHCLDGFVNKVDDWQTELAWVGRDGLVVFDDVIFAGAQDELRQDGYRVVGGGAASDRLELDRTHFNDVLQRHGVMTLPSYDFQTAEAAKAFIAANPKKWVLKHSSHISTATYVGQQDDGRDVLDLLHIYEAKKIGPIHLQLAVEGVEVGVARYFNGLDWIGPIEFNVEHKALFPGDIGPLTGEMGTLMWYEDNEDIPLFSRTLARIKEHLCSINYKGDIDINCIVNEDGIWPLEATTRFGSPATQVQCELHQSSWADFLGAVADGRPFNLAYFSGFAVGVTVAMPPFPFGPEFLDGWIPPPESTTRIFVSGDLTEHDLRKLHLEEVTATQGGVERKYNHRGRDGNALFVTGSGKTPQEAQKDAYRILDGIHMPRMFYRNDIGERFIRSDWDRLRSWGVV